MKKIFIFMLLIVSMMVIAGCGKGDSSTDNSTQVGGDDPVVSDELYKNDEVKTTESESEIILENNFISVSFNASNGSLISLKNKLANTDYLKDSVGGNWAMTVDTSTGNPFSTNYQGDNAILVTSRTQKMTHKLESTSTKATLVLTYNVSFEKDGVEYSDIVIKNTIVIEKAVEEVTFEYEIINNCEHDITICNFTGAQLTGLKDSQNEELKLFWPNKEGKIYDSAISKITKSTNGKENLSNVYPGLCSMQLIQLFNEVEGLYYFVEDPTREYKIANYGDQTIDGGYDYSEVQTTDKVALSFTQFPFVGAKQTKKAFKTVVGVSVYDSWYKGSDRYQEFLVENEFLRNYDDFEENWKGFCSLVGSEYGSKHFATYTSTGAFQENYSSWINNVSESCDIQTELILGWNEGGFDSKYPDYDFATGEGFNGAIGFKQMADSVHKDGNIFCCHINSRIADMESNWSQTVNGNGIYQYQSAGIKLAGYQDGLTSAEMENYLICETYGTGTMYYVMSPASKEFQEQLISVVTRLRQNGCNGLWFDQLFERDAKLDYDEAHRMSETSTPATLYFEGYSYLMSKFDEIAVTINPSEPWIMVCGGGAGDALAKYVDVYGGNWNRKLGAKDNSKDNSLLKIGTENCDKHVMSPELSKYTVPSIYIGQAGAGTLAGQQDEYARAFVFGSPFLVEQVSATVTTKSLLAVYDYYPDIFYKGTFTDMKGLSVSDSDVLGSIILSNSQKSFAIQLYNYDTNKTENCSISINLDKLGIKGNITSVTNLFTGETYTVKNNTFTYSLAECEMASFHVTYQ